MANLTDQPIYETNPFEGELVDKMDIVLKPDGKQTIKGHRVSISGKGKDAAMFYLKPEIVDRREFVKIYAGHFKTLFGLSKSTQKVFAYIADECTRIGSDKVFIDFLECKKKAEVSGKNTISKCLAELCIKDIIKRTPNRNMYFINPLIVFNGSVLTIVRQVVSKSDSSAYTATRGLLSQPNTNFLNEPKNEKKD